MPELCALRAVTFAACAARRAFELGELILMSSRSRSPDQFNRWWFEAFSHDLLVTFA
jgi:hypothetical protein